MTLIAYYRHDKCDISRRNTQAAVRVLLARSHQEGRHEQVDHIADLQTKGGSRKLATHVELQAYKPKVAFIDPRANRVIELGYVRRMDVVGLAPVDLRAEREKIARQRVQP